MAEISKIEYRRFNVGKPILRGDEDESDVSVEGYAAVFNEMVDIGGYFREVIQHGAFTKAIKRDDVVFLINHEGLPLARTTSGTLKLTQDKHGLKIDSRLALADPDVSRIVTKMERGDLNKMSFAFVPTKESWEEIEGETPIRTILEAELRDVSIVNNPAYDGTEIGLRELRDYEATKKDGTSKNIHRRLRLKNGLRIRSLTIDLKKGSD